MAVVWSGGRDESHGFGVRHERSTAFVRESANRERVFAFERFGDGYVTRFFQFGEMAGKIALGESTFALEIEEIRFRDRVEDRHDHEACRFVNDAIECGESLEVWTHDVCGWFCCAVDATSGLA